MDRPQEIRGWTAGLLLFLAAVSAEMAWAHARAASALGVICGEPPATHCAWCLLALVSGASGLLLLRRRATTRLQAALARTRSGPRR